MRFAGGFNGEQNGNPTVKREAPVERSTLCLVSYLTVVALCGCAATRYEEYGPPVEANSPLPVPPSTEEKPENKDRLSELESYITRLEAELSSRLSGLEMANSDFGTQLLSLAEQLEIIRK